MRTLVDEERLSRLAKLVKETCPLEGVMAELGVYHGGSAHTIAAACPTKTLHLFDTFTGIPEDDSYAGGHHKGDFFDFQGEEETLLPWVKRELKDFSLIEYHVGFFPDTAKGLEDLRFSFVHLDADIYQSTIAGIKFFRPRMVSGGIIVFDDYHWPACHGVSVAVHENFPADWIKTARQQCYVKFT